MPILIGKYFLQGKMQPSQHQLESLTDFLEQNSGIAKGHLRTAHAKQEEMGRALCPLPH